MLLLQFKFLWFKLSVLLMKLLAFFRSRFLLLWLFIVLLLLGLRLRLLLVSVSLLGLLLFLFDVAGVAPRVRLDDLTPRMRFC